MASTDVNVAVLRGLDVVDLCVDCESTRGHKADQGVLLVVRFGCLCS
jgi:hypothetical protein